jgi:hypothetical protein
VFRPCRVTIPSRIHPDLAVRVFGERTACSLQPRYMQGAIGGASLEVAMGSVDNWSWCAASRSERVARGAVHRFGVVIQLQFACDDCPQVPLGASHVAITTLRGTVRGSWKARVARADLPEFCKQCRGHPECTKFLPQPSGDCRTARVARADLPEFCKQCRGHPECKRFLPQPSASCATQCSESHRRCMAGVAAEGEKRFRSEKARQDALRQLTNDCRVAQEMCRRGCG